MPQVSENSIDSVSDRDFVIEFLAAASICMMHLSRFSEELILWSSSEFGFVEISDAYTTGSSIMPQKKNPDVAELVRGKSGRVYGDLMTMLTLMKSLPLAYNRDMQEDKEPLFDAVNTLKACIDIYARMIPRMNVNKDAMERATMTGFLNATDFADYLAEKGMPFREAHGIVGKAVQYALEQKKELHELSLKELKIFFLPGFRRHFFVPDGGEDDRPAEVVRGNFGQTGGGCRRKGRRAVGCRETGFRRKVQGHRRYLEGRCL